MPTCLPQPDPHFRYRASSVDQGGYSRWQGSNSARNGSFTNFRTRMSHLPTALSSCRFAGSSTSPTKPRPLAAGVRRAQGRSGQANERARSRELSAQTHRRQSDQNHGGCEYCTILIRGEMDLLTPILCSHLRLASSLLLEICRARLQRMRCARGERQNERQTADCGFAATSG
jgi:hypothetical protein